MISYFHSNYCVVHKNANRVGLKKRLGGKCINGF
jgi:hypothetical protein